MHEIPMFGFSNENPIDLNKLDGAPAFQILG